LNLPGLIFVLIFAAAIVGLGIARRRSLSGLQLRDIPAFGKLANGIGLAVEAGQRLHLSLGRGGVLGVPGASTFLGLSLLNRVARTASVSDFPPVATSGEGAQAILSQDTLHNAYQTTNIEGQFDPNTGLLTGLTPFSYAAGALPVVYDDKVSVNVLAGSFGSEAALIADAAERTGSTVLAGSENLAAQAIFYAATPEPLIGEELFAAGAYVQAGATHASSLMAQDIFRVVIILFLLLGAALKLVGVW
jgi:hypothetical protein